MDAELKTCGGGCGRTYPLTAFYKNTKSPDGLDYRCKGCVRRKRRARYAPKGKLTGRPRLPDPEPAE